MTSPFGIEIQFFPFALRPFERSQRPALSLHSLPDVAWCSLPDILFASTSREFVGLSFAIDPGKEEIGQQLCSDSIHVRLLHHADYDYLNRYQGFGHSSRLEVIWSINSTVECEPASLSDGYWLGTDSMVPRAYRIVGLPDLLADHSLRWPDV